MATDLNHAQPLTLPITVEQYRLLVNQGTFARQSGQVQLIHGRVTRMNPQGPMHADPVDELGDWSHEVARETFRIRIEKPIEIPLLHSSPEPDVAWVTRRRYVDRHPLPADVHLLIEVSESSQAFDRGEKLQLYAAAGIKEYWVVDVPEQVIDVFTEPSPTGFGKLSRYQVGNELHPGCLPAAKLLVGRLFSQHVR